MRGGGGGGGEVEKEEEDDDDEEEEKYVLQAKGIKPQAQSKGENRCEVMRLDGSFTFSLSLSSSWKA